MMLSIFAAAAIASSSMDVFGITLSEPLSAYPECDYELLDGYRGVLKSYRSIQSVSCYEESADQDLVRDLTLKFHHSERPAIISGDVLPKVIADRVELISFDGFGPSGQPSLFRALSEKFGRPTSSGTEILQNAYGAKVTILYATWRVGDVSIEFDGAESNARGRVVISTGTWRAYQMAIEADQNAKRKPL